MESLSFTTVNDRFKALIDIMETMSPNNYLITKQACTYMVSDLTLVFAYEYHINIKSPRTSYLVFVVVDQLYNVVPTITDHMHEMLIGYLTWRRHHQEDFESGWLIPNLATYLSDQIHDSIVLDTNQVLHPMCTSDKGTFVLDERAIDAKPDERPFIRKGRFTRSRYEVAVQKMRSFTNKMTKLLEEFPGLRHTHTWADFIDDLVDNNGYETPDDSDVESVGEGPEDKRLSSRKKKRVKRS